jgi:hypothetical protein
MIKRQNYSFFCDDCRKCAQRGRCVSATSFNVDFRRYFLKIRGAREELTELMRRGIERHEEHLKDFSEPNIFGIKIIRQKILEGRPLIMKEVKVCSPLYGLRGIIDKLEIRKENGEWYITATELKSSWFKNYIFQLGTYGLILSDLKCRTILKRTVRKTKEVAYYLYPIALKNLNVSLCLQIFDRKPVVIDWMRDNHLTEKAHGIGAFIQSQANRYRSFHKLGIYYLNEIRPCRGCDSGNLDNRYKCGLWDRYCSKVSYENAGNHRQKYLGKKKLLIKTKPAIYRVDIDKSI